MLAPRFLFLVTPLLKQAPGVMLLTCTLRTFLGDVMSCLLGARAYVVLPVHGRRLLVGGAFRQSKDTSMLEHLCSMLVACDPPVNSLHGATSRNVAGSRTNQHCRLISNHVSSRQTVIKIHFLQPDVL